MAALIFGGTAMEFVLSQFVKSLAESGLMNEDETQTFIDSLPPEKMPDDGAALAEELVRQKRIRCGVLQS
jgi:hypothetical protein